MSFFMRMTLTAALGLCKANRAECCQRKSEAKIMAFDDVPKRRRVKQIKHRVENRPLWNSKAQIMIIITGHQGS